MLGSSMVNGFREAYGADVVMPFDRQAVDVTDDAAVEAIVARTQPTILLNCAGYNAVDLAEDHPVEALRVNAFAVRALARAAGAIGATLIHYSSDFVFDGTATRPHTEAERPNPQSVYAVSKMLGEWFAADVPHAYVLRVESLFGRWGNGPERGSAATILEALRSGAAARVFEDRTVSLTYVPDAVLATQQLLNRQAPAGLYHCANTGSCTWLEFAQEAARLLDITPQLEVVRFKEMKFRAPRPLYCALSNEKLAAAGVSMPTWQDALARHLRPHSRSHVLSDRLADQLPNRQA